MAECRCKGLCWLDDPTACGDPDHCSPMYPCPDCNPTGIDECPAHEEPANAI